MRELLLPTAEGTLRRYRPGSAQYRGGRNAPARCRVAFAAAHVVADPLRSWGPDGPTMVDWEATLAYRAYLWELGLGVAEAMDTAQRGMGLDWPTARELIRRSSALARAVGGRLACGVGTDQLAPSRAPDLAAVRAAYMEQCGFVQEQGSQIIVMASRQLAACARGPEDYLAVYDRILSQAQHPVILHWLGDMFDPLLHGYWGSADLSRAMDTCLQVVALHPGKVDGIKLSLLDPVHELRLRQLLPQGVRLYTGDDFHYPELILGDEQGHSDALLGIFDAIAPSAAHALAALDQGDTARYRAILEPTVPLARHVFAPPTHRYKTGVVFLAYLNGHQRHFRMVGGQESARSVVHLAELFILADRAGVLRDPELAAHRMGQVLQTAGVGEERGA